MLKKIGIGILVFLAASVTVYGLVCMWVFIRYGRVTPPANGNVTIHDYKDRYVVYARNTEPAHGLVIYPANLVDASNYLWLAGTVSARTGSTVFIIKPPSRIASRAPDWHKIIKGSQEETGDWTVIGHSAGAAAACKYAKGTFASAHEAKLKQIIILDGYCRGKIPVKTTYIWGSKDKLNFRAPDLNDIKVIPGGGHFMPVDGRFIDDLTTEIAKLL